MNIYVCRLCGKSGHDASYSLLSRAYKDLTGSDMPEIKKTAMGKPYFPDDPHVHFSVSHTKTHAACAIGLSPVGVDIEILRIPSSRIEERISSEAERNQFSFISLWTLKESYIKYIGDNTLKMKDIVFTESHGNILGPNGTFGSLFSCIRGCQIAFCSSSPDTPQIIIDNFAGNL